MRLGIIASLWACILGFALASNAKSTHTGLYVPGWYQSSNQNGANFWNYTGVDLSGVSAAYYSFIFINSPYSLYDPFGTLQ